MARDAIYTLGRIHSNPAVAVSALLHVYTWQDASYYITASDALAEFGSAAAAAIPVLEQELTASVTSRERAARLALSQIDPVKHPYVQMAPPASAAPPVQNSLDDDAAE